MVSNDNEFLIGGDELFENVRFVNHYNFMLKNYQPNTDRPIAFFLSCSKHKPFYKSPYRRVFFSMLRKKLAIRQLSQIYTISEPAIIVPEELEDTDITKYDFPPERLQQKGRTIFIHRLSKLLPKLLKAHLQSFYVLPKHHRGIFETAMKEIYQNPDNGITNENFAQKITYAPPVIYNLPKVRKIIRKKLTQRKIIERKWKDSE